MLGKMRLLFHLKVYTDMVAMETVFDIFYHFKSYKHVRYSFLILTEKFCCVLKIAYRSKYSSNRNFVKDNSGFINLIS